MPATQKYVRTTELPDAIAFNMLLLRLETIVNAGYRDDIVDEISKNLGFDQIRSSAFLDQLLAVKGPMTSEIKAEACTSSGDSGLQAA